MKKAEWALLLSSALLYSVPFLWSDYCWWAIIAFPIPLFYLACCTQLSSIHGYIWACVICAVHMSGGIYVMAIMAHEWWPVAVGLGSIMILYHALWAGILFAAGAFIMQALCLQKAYQRLLMSVMVVWLFIAGIDWYSLSFFGAQEGYTLMHPLILLAKKPHLLYLLPIVGKQLLTLFFLMFSMGIVLIWWYGNWYSVLFLSAVSIPWLLSIAMQRPLRECIWQQRIKGLPLMVCSQNPVIFVKIIQNSLKNILQAHTTADIIIMPESACTLDKVSDISELLRCWHEHNLGKPIHLIFGASRSDADHYYNSLQWVYNGVLQNYHDKKHAMLLSERLPWFLDNSYFQSIYFTQRKQITASDAVRSCIKIDDMIFVPYICSELFCHEKSDDEYPAAPIIAIVNDSIFLSSLCSAYMSDILLLLARFKAIQWQREIMYVSYAHCVVIDRQGSMHDI